MNTRSYQTPSEEYAVPIELRKPSIQLLVLAAGIVLLTGFAFGLSGGGLSADADTPMTAQLEIDGVSYTFAPTTCTITDTDFVAAGSGDLNGEPFWVSASGDGVNLSVGSESEVERPAEDQLWLVSVNKVRWQAEDDSITASAWLRDERDTNARAVSGRLSVECPVA